MADPYKQRLPALGLSIERGTPDVPDDGAFHLLRDGVELRSYRSLAAAQKAWKTIVAESGWQPAPKVIRSPEEMLEAERSAADRDARNEYWHSGRRHSW